MRTDFDVRPRFAKGGMPPRNKKNFRPTKPDRDWETFTPPKLP